MAGHSKWANIKHKKAREDAKRGKVFTKLIRELVVAAKQGGGDPDSNPRLRLAIDKARAANMTKDTMDRAIKRGAGGEEGGDLEEIRYEGYGPNGVAVMVDCLTDNRNRTVAEVRHAFTKFGGNLGTDGSVSYLFSQQGMINFPTGSDEDKIMEIAIDAGADDVVSNPDASVDVFTSPDQFEAVISAINATDIKPENAEVTQVASTQVELDKDSAESLLKMLDVLEDLDDVQNVYTNANFPDDLLNEM